MNASDWHCKPGLTPVERADRLASIIEAVGVKGLPAHSWRAIKDAIADAIQTASSEAWTEGHNSAVTAIQEEAEAAGAEHR